MIPTWASAKDDASEWEPPPSNAPQILEAWTCMRCGYPHSITTKDKARGIIDQDRCHCGENFYDPKR